MNGLHETDLNNRCHKYIELSKSCCLENIFVIYTSADIPYECINTEIVWWACGDVWWACGCLMSSVLLVCCEWLKTVVSWSPTHASLTSDTRLRLSLLSHFIGWLWILKSPHNTTSQWHCANVLIWLIVLFQYKINLNFKLSTQCSLLDCSRVVVWWCWSFLF